MKITNRFKSAQMMRSIGLSATVAVFIAGCAGIPPTEQMAVSKAAVNNANSAGGNEYAPLPLRSAMEKMDAAEQAMRDKEYELARQLSEQAQVDAQLAAAKARAAKAQKAAAALKEGTKVLRQEIDRNTP
ncbi:MAG: DUF4398 domain-containing protein [Methylicorpusculum sp.]|uniref:DUF4398 domain-containing protein n=1 Tax=Methylicorpusculum sp. TaxID=2713644 RepID=UPI002722BE38|nr:DUF4398 domain-containing protein [Methylicorpusculum sp.]MDO8939769.1 DUF4398 domain-containing protein [Methylicorpusculum sp.]MDO9238376.1 DUF4398 domain-containing protein [Methylicorpusculum sp.]MDP2201877.1 DUF4398 domain-containing protein [Methylicorpusculum sp.]